MAQPGRAESPKRSPGWCGVRGRAPASPTLIPRYQPPAVGGQGGRGLRVSPGAPRSGDTKRGRAGFSADSGVQLPSLSRCFPQRPACPKAARGSLRRLKAARAPPGSRGRSCRAGSGARPERGERPWPGGHPESCGGAGARAPRCSRGALSWTLSPKGGMEYGGCEL